MSRGMSRGTVLVIDFPTKNKQENRPYAHPGRGNIMKKTLVLTAFLLGATSLAQPIVMPTAQAASVKTFRDIQGHWAQPEIEKVVSVGAIDGFADGTFRPQETVTRAQFSKILAGVMGVQSNDLAFSNMKGHWAAPYVNGLEDKGVIIRTDYPSGYNPNEVITRLEMSKMIARGLASESATWNSALNGLRNLDYIKVTYTDKNKLVARDMPLIALAEGAGIVRGRADGSYDPAGRATRAEAAVMLNRFLNAKVKNISVDEFVNKYKGEKSIHDYTKAEIAKWIDKEADLKRLNSHPIEHDFHKTLASSNQSMLFPTVYQNKTAYYQENHVDVVNGFMNTYFNRDYRTIGTAFINDIRYYYGTSFIYEGDLYKDYELGKLFNRFVQETKNEKRISESIFVTDISMVYSKQKNYEISKPRVRGTQYIRYTSGSNLPKGLKLNTWYKRDVDVEIIQKSKNPKVVTWDTALLVFNEIYPITSYQEVVK